MPKEVCPHESSPSRYRCGGLLNPCKTAAASLLKERKFFPASFSVTLKPLLMLALHGSRYGILPLRAPESPPVR